MKNYFNKLCVPVFAASLFLPLTASAQELALQDTEHATDADQSSALMLFQKIINPDKTYQALINPGGKSEDFILFEKFKIMAQKAGKDELNQIAYAAQQMLSLPNRRNTVKAIMDAYIMRSFEELQTDGGVFKNIQRWDIPATLNRILNPETDALLKAVPKIKSEEPTHFILNFSAEMLQSLFSALTLARFNLNSTPEEARRALETAKTNNRTTAASPWFKLIESAVMDRTQNTATPDVKISPTTSQSFLLKTSEPN